jgi:aryl-alcohol dehydrogenase-like predicted oxidoreductase
MDFRRLGNSGLVVSVVGLGTNNLGMKLDMDQSREVVDAALEQGITLFDTADSYGQSEQRLGELLEGRRDDVVIATKFGSDVRRLGNDNGVDWDARGSRRYIRRAVEASLRRLRTDWIDLYQLHRPDPQTPIEETLAALTELVREGKVRYLGHSNFTGWQAAEADWTSRTRGHERFVSAQNDYSWLNREVEADLVPALEHYGVGLLPFFPLASGLLTGKYRRGESAAPGTRIKDREPVHHAAGRGDGRPGRPTGREQCHRRGHLGRAGSGQRGGRQLAAHRG